MKRFYRNSFLFILPVALAILLIPVNERLRFIGLKNECFDHGILLYDRIYNNPSPVDIAFLGSSQTINGINDTLIQKKLNNEKQVFNFGYCTLGQNLYYTLLKMLVKGKKIKTLVLEVRNDENTHSHRITPYISDTKDVLFPFMVGQDYFSDSKTHLLYKMELFQDITFGRIKQTDYRMENYGYAASGKKATETFLDSIKMVRSLPAKYEIEMKRELLLNYPRMYLEGLSEICKENRIKIMFLYIPVYGNYNKPREYDTYIKYGTVILPPEKIFTKKENWFDENHLNTKGADELSGWLADTYFLEF